MADPGPPHVDVAGYVLGSLDARERETFERHLAGCRACQRDLEDMRGMPALLARAAEPVEVPAGMQSRVLGTIGGEPRPASGTAAAGPRRARPRRTVTWALGAAAAVALAFLAGLGLGRGLPAGGQPAYTCWLVADDDTLQRQDRVSVGSFETSPDGTATVRWETAADPARYPHLGVTLEPDNGSPLHQGPKVLTAAA